MLGQPFRNTTNTNEDAILDHPGWCDSAKACIPLLILGQGVPKGVLDDRLFQQADLLRMLDRSLTPGARLSPFAVWVERYVFVYGVASSASNVQIFEATDMGRRGYRLNLRGAEIEWVDRPAKGWHCCRPAFIASISDTSIDAERSRCN